jgi:pimeloyl-ACP methyl ester carboxylesterase
VAGGRAARVEGDDVPFLAVDRCDLYYEIHGRGPALVFAHGLGGSHLTWWQQVPHFRDRYTCVTFAHRGFGLSREAPGGPGPDAFVNDLAALVDHLGLADVRLIAQSMGGWTCLGYALRAPDRVRALVMGGTTGSCSTPEIQAIFAAHAAKRPEAALVERGIHPACGERMAREQPALHFLYQAVDALTRDLDKPAIRNRLIALRTTTPEAVAALQVPVLCLTGEEDVVIPPAAVEAFARVIPGARLARVEAAGHSVYWERPSGFNRLVDEFLASVDRSSA